MKMATLADTFDVNIAPHNFYSHHATMMNVHFAAAVPNLRIMETDIDRLSWDDEIVTHVPRIVNGAIEVPDSPGWGCDPIEAALRAHPPKLPVPR
jgi:L-alanine-DL-glutamate epimerase-like enolase superfamily enzyme